MVAAVAFKKTILICVVSVSTARIMGFHLIEFICVVLRGMPPQRKGERDRPLSYV